VSRRTRIIARGGVALAVTAAMMVAPGCGGVQSPLNPSGPEARSIAALMWWFFAVCAVMYLIVMGAILWAIARRRRPDDDSPETSKRMAQVIAGWVALTVVILVALSVYSVVTGRILQAPPARAGLTIEAVGHQWWWEFNYRSGGPADRITSPNELHVPVGVPVVIRVASRDVIHSLWVPNLMGKRDMVPGMVTEVSLQADRPGTYRGQCAEFCGYQHANMAFLLVAEPMAQFRTWLASQRRSASAPSTPLATRGHDVFMSGSCALCHTVRGTSAGSRLGPDLTHVASRQTIAAGTLPNTRGHRAGWVADSQSIKPGNRMPPSLLGGDDLQAVLAYLEILR
jgi:cytochrome c oxidase subunit 2